MEKIHPTFPYLAKAENLSIETTASQNIMEPSYISFRPVPLCFSFSHHISSY